MQIQLGHLDVREISDKEYVLGFIQARAGRLNVDLNTWDIHIDNQTGCVTAHKAQSGANTKVIYEN